MKLPTFFRLSVLLLLISFAVASASEEAVEIENGKIVGEKYEDFIAYRGIPYAEPPVGSLRFAAPRPYVEKWENEREFKSYQSNCAQYSHFGYEFEGNEDCLFLNVFVPKTVSRLDEKVPVIFYIHGGAFMFGGGKGYGPENIMESQNMILITINYRLGVFGFLSTEDEAIPGNFGLKDQVEALKWVQRNIEAFNGDPKRVTIVGYSAGGASVQLHYMSPLSDGLFNNGISHSGNSLDPWVMVENSRKKAESLAASVNCPTEDHEQLRQCLRKKPAKDLAMFAKTYQPFLYNPFSPFGIVVEVPNDSAFITDHPKNLLKLGNFKKLPWLLSQTQDEGLYPAAEFYSDEKYLAEINEKWTELAPFILDFNETSTDTKLKKEVSVKIREYYLGQAEISKQSFHHFCDIITDRLFKHGAKAALQLQSKFSPSYLYLFRYKSRTGLAEFMAKTTENIGISHGEDVLLIYNHGLRDIPYSDEEKIMSNSLTEMYHNFASKNLSIYSDLEIQACKPDALKYMVITSPKDFFVTLVDSYFGNVEFWNEVENTLADKKKKNNHDEL